MYCIQRLTTLRLLILFFLVLGCSISPFSVSGKVQTAQAQFGLLSDFLGGGDIVKDPSNILQNTIQALSLQSLEQKELVIDGMFFNMAQKALQQMTGEIISWLNSGLDGAPAFVTDILGNLQEVSDNEAAAFIYSDDLSTICPSFQPDVRKALAKSYAEKNYEGFKKKVECPLEGGDAEAFVGGNFFAGGWAGWFEVMTHFEATPIGAVLAGEKELARRTAAAQFAINTELDYGNGVFSKKACTTVGTGANARQSCVITTPGAIMQDLASKALGTGIDSLLNADEANEVIGLLFGNIANEAITGVNGLLGLGGNTEFSNNSFGTEGNLSYLDAIRQEQVAGANQAVGNNQIQQALITETRVLDLQLAIVDVVSTTTTSYASARAPYKTNSCWDLALPESFATTLTQMQQKMTTTIPTILALQTMAEQYASSTSSNVQLNLLQQLSVLQSQKKLSGQSTVVELDFFLNSELKPFITEFKRKIATEVQGCS
ncbi:MAG: hypothetical protein RLZZ76_412 [Candidatus Parcubacteria bacterium]|jgi:hypothetical protein